MLLQWKNRHVMRWQKRRCGAENQSDWFGSESRWAPPRDVGLLPGVFADEHEAHHVSVAAKATINRPDRKIMERPYVR